MITLRSDRFLIIDRCNLISITELGQHQAYHFFSTPKTPLPSHVIDTGATLVAACPQRSYTHAILSSRP